MRTDAVEPGLAEIESLLEAQTAWGGQAIEPPSRDAVDRAKRAYETLVSAGFAPDRILASGEGGVALCFLYGDAYADLEFLNCGDLIASTQDRTSGASELWEFSFDRLTDTIHRLQRFLAAHAEGSVQ